MKLTIQERLMTLAVLPQETDFTTLRVVRGLQETLSPSEEEIKKFDIKTRVADGQAMTSWNEDGNKVPVEVKIGEMANQIIVDALKKLNEEKKLTADHFAIYEKFVEPPKK